MQATKKIILIGLGKVGREVIRQIHGSGINVQIVALVDSSAFLSTSLLSVEQINHVIRAKKDGKRLADLPDSQPMDTLSELFDSNTIIVDTSAAMDLDWQVATQKGCKLVFANKNAHSAGWGEASRLFNQAGIRYESTVGAGLPVLTSLRNQIQLGDSITRIEGVMSGTLGFLCSQLQAGVPYSKAVQEAFEAGYTEPDPRDDLSGFDVLRKALILARTAGWPLEQKDVTVQPLYDDRLVGIPVAEFFRSAELLNQTYREMVDKAAAEGKVLRYLATVTPQGGIVGLQAVDHDSALGALQGPGNYFAIYSASYNQIPLVISGPGAGIEVTANGVLSDIIALI
jgi:homoserine dehydrogenase